MDQNNKPNRGITGYILLLLILLGILSMVSFYTGRRGGYTIQNMEEVLSSGLVEGARITPGQTPPTGSVELTLSNGGQMIVQVTDVAKAEEIGFLTTLKVPKPTNVILSPFLRVSPVTAINASSAFLASVLEIFASVAIALMSSDLFMVFDI